jgi:alpha-L-arabinofuranosidase
MDYSTFKLNSFFIKQNSTLPEIKFPLTQQLREQYNITEDMLESVAVTFSMKDADTGLYKIANVAANLRVVNHPMNHHGEEKYTLAYRFSVAQTAKAGRFWGEFKVDFLSEGNCGKITLPVDNYIDIIISPSSTKTTVI